MFRRCFFLGLMLLPLLGIHGMICEHSQFGNGVNVCVNRIIEQLAIPKQMIQDSFSQTFIDNNPTQSSTEVDFEKACKKWKSDIVPYYEGESSDFVNNCREIYKDPTGKFRQVVCIFLSEVLSRLERHKIELEEILR